MQKRLLTITHSKTHQNKFGLVGLKTERVLIEAD